jgi:hypothetical protein
MLTVVKFAKKVKRSRIRIYQLLKDGRIEGATVDGLGNWEIPDKAVLPERQRQGRKVSRQNMSSQNKVK